MQEKIISESQLVNDNSNRLDMRRSFIAHSKAILLTSPLLMLSPPVMSEPDIDPLLSMSLAELMEMEVSNAGSLTATSTRKIPAAVTRITARDIEKSGARSMLELLDIYIPGVEWLRHHWEFSHLGSRGIISDREDKVMIRLNGHVMNEHTHTGAISERNFPMMQDIDYIDVIRGPGSSLYGLGAVSLVIDIHTNTANTVENNKVSVRGGIGQNFQSVEGQFSHKLDNDMGIWFYAAAANMEGANESKAPLVLGVDAISQISRTYIPAGQAFPVQVNDGLQYKNQSPLKLHLQVNNKNTDFWARYTRAGEVEPSDVFFVAEPPVGLGHPKQYFSEFGYEQFTTSVSHKHQLNENTQLTGTLSYDSTELAVSVLPGFIQDSNHREEEWAGKLQLDWKASQRSDIAAGVELSHETFGLRGNAQDNPYSRRLGFIEPWSTNTASLVGEWQWRPNEKWTSFLGGRIDKNTYGKTLYSPRTGIVWTPTETDTWKLLASRSQRMNFAEENRAEALAGNHKSLPEKLDSLELRYEHVRGNQRFSISAFALSLDAIGWDNQLKKSELVGTQKQTGLEMEWEKQFDKFHVNVSHAYTRLTDFDLKAKDTIITAAPFGYGNDLSNWSNNITKAQVSYHVNDKLDMNSSLRVYWGFPGLQDKINRKIDSGVQWINPGADKASKKQVFLNIGGAYKLNKKSKVGVDLYNVLGLANHDYNKRVYLDSNGDYRSEAPAAMITYTVEF